MPIRVIVNNVISTATDLKVLTAGMVRGRAVKFEFSPDWNNLNKTAVFTNGIDTRIIPEYKWEDGIIYIPPEVLATPYRFVKCGIYGMNDSNEIVIPTLWADLGRVFPSAYPADYEESVPPTPNVWDDLQNQIGILTQLQTKYKYNLVGAINELILDGVNPDVIAKAINKYLDENLKEICSSIVAEGIPVNNLLTVNEQGLIDDSKIRCEDIVTSKIFENRLSKMFYTHVQDLSSTEWVITHNLGRIPSVTVVDTSNTVVVGEVTYISENKLSIKFSSPLSGKAFLN